MEFHMMYYLHYLQDIFMYLYIHFVCYLRSLVWKWQPLPCSLWRARGRQWTQLTMPSMFLCSWSLVTSATMLFSRCAHNAHVTSISEIWNVSGFVNCLIRSWLFCQVKYTFRYSEAGEILNVLASFLLGAIKSVTVPIQQEFHITFMRVLNSTLSIFSSNF